jgi:predicted ABC-type ATPase
VWHESLTRNGGFQPTPSVAGLCEAGCRWSSGFSLPYTALLNTLSRQYTRQMATNAGSKKIIIIAGPNGAGKTTFARSFLPQDARCPRFINADLIAAGLSPFQPEAAAIRAGRLMLEEINNAVAHGETFAFETTLAGVGYLRRIRHWRNLGYHVSLFYLRLPDVEMAIARVATRVRQGGHNIPEDVIRRRFDASLRNFDQVYKAAVNDWTVYNNAGSVPILLDWKEIV